MHLHADGLIHEMEKSSPSVVVADVFPASQSFDPSQARNFIFQLKDEIKGLYGIDLDLDLVVDETLKIMASSGQFSQDQVEMAKRFYRKLLTPEVMHFQSCKKPHKKKHKEQELHLDDNLAVGFACMLGGGLLCILPFGITQTIGSGLIGYGIYTAIEGTKKGEKAYYIDSDSEKPKPAAWQLRRTNCR
jgi:hypothetical protein